MVSNYFASNQNVMCIRSGNAGKEIQHVIVHELLSPLQNACLLFLLYIFQALTATKNITEKYHIYYTVCVNSLSVHFA